MSVASQVVATATPIVTASPSPQVVKEVVTQTVQVTPEQIRALLQLILLVGSGAVASVVHALIERGRWAFGVNYAILFVYSFLIAGLDLFLQGSLHFDNLPALVGAFLTVFAAAQIRYNTSKALVKASTPQTVEAAPQF